MSESEQPVAANVLARDFTASAPNTRWVSDTTELSAGGSRLYLAVIVDLFSRFAVGWAGRTRAVQIADFSVLDPVFFHAHPNYTGSYDFDMAVLGVPVGPRTGVTSRSRSNAPAR